MAPLCGRPTDEEQRLVVKTDKSNRENPSLDREIKDADIKIYKRRFWILGIFFYLSFLVLVGWGVFGPITESAVFALGWDRSTIALFSGLPPLVGLLCSLPLGWMTDTYGARSAVLIATTTTMVGMGLRCMSRDDTAFTWLTIVSAIVIGIGVPIAFSLPTLVAATWFPRQERATATAVASLSLYVARTAFYLGPLIVRTPSSALTKLDIKNDIFTLMYIHFGLAVVCWVCTCIYFPSKPPKPPSISASTQRVNYFQSIKLLARNPQFMLVIVTYALVSINTCWIPVMNFSFNCLGITQNQTMWIAVTATLVSLVVSFIVARLTDYFYGHIKISTIVLYIGASCCYLWFLLISENVITYSLGQVRVAIVCAISLQAAAFPLLFELAAELVYPCPECVVGYSFIFLMNITDTLFFLLLMTPNLCYRWLNMFLFGVSSLSVIIMCFVKETYERSHLDHRLEDIKK